MNKEKAAPLVAQQEPQGREDGTANQNPRPTHIVHGVPPDVKFLSGLIHVRHIPLIEMVNVVRTLYPMCDRSLLSKCAHGNENGAALRSDALKALEARFMPEARKRRSERARKKPNRLVCRVTDAVYAPLQRRLKRTGQTVQDYIETLILRDLTGGDNEKDLRSD